MSNQSSGYDDPKNLKLHREVRERSNSSPISPKDFVRLQAERTERTKRADGIEKSMARQKEAQEQIDKQLVNGENKDIDSPDSPSIRTKGYEDMRAKILQAAEGRMKENAVPDSLNVEQGLSRERQIELSERFLREQRVIRHSMQKPLVDTKPESDRSIPVSDNTNVPTYKREIEQIQELIDTERTAYAYFNPKEGSVYITDKLENAQAKFRNDAIANLEPGYQLNGIRRVDLEYAKMGVEDEKYGLKPELDITAPQVENLHDKKAEGELKIGDQDTKANSDQKLTSVKDFVGAANADKLPVWMQKEDIHIEDFIEYRDNKSLAPQEFMQLAQNKPLERESIPADPDAWRNRFNPEDFRDFDQDKPFEHEVVGEAQEKKSFAENEKEYIARKDKLDEIYGQIEKLGAKKAVSEEIADRKERIDADLIQLDAMYQVKEKTTSQEVKDSYDRFYKEKFKDLEETIEFMQKALDQRS
jgi:hypothetical protein